MNNNELKIMVPNGWIVNEEVMADGSRMLVIKPNTTIVENTSCHLREGIFKKVPASELSLEDDFLKYTPKTEREKLFKKEVKKVIKAGVHDFWRPVCDPSIDDNGRICYEPGKMVVDDKSYDWWEKKAKDFCPERGSRLGTKNEYIAFLAVLIKDLVDSGKSIKWAWNAVCNDSKELGNYDGGSNSNEPTGSREICGWCDLANIQKILAKDKYGTVWITSGKYWYDSRDFTLAFIYPADEEDGEVDGESFNCGWLVLER